jgi:multidrug resistance efflux pump
MENDFISLSKMASDSIDASFATAIYPQSQIDSQKNTMQQYVSSSQQNLTNITSTSADITKLSDPTLIKQQSDSNIAKQTLQVKTLQDALIKLKNSLNDLQNNLEYKTSQYESQIEQKQFSIDSAKTNVSVSEANLSYLQNGGTEQSIALLKNNIAKQQLALESAKKQAKNYELRAPFNGIINQIDFQNGDNIVADDSKYVYIQNPNLVRITALLDQLDIAKTAIGQKVTITFDSYAKKKFE